MLSISKKKTSKSFYQSWMHCNAEALHTLISEAKVNIWNTSNFVFEGKFQESATNHKSYKSYFNKFSLHHWWAFKEMCDTT